MPTVNIPNEEVVFLKDMSPDDIEEILNVLESKNLGIEIKRPLDYDIRRRPIMTIKKEEEFIEEMTRILRHERKIGKDRYFLRVTRSGDQEAYLVRRINPNVLDLVVVKGLNEDKGNEIAEAGRGLKIEVGRPLYYLPKD